MSLELADGRLLEVFDAGPEDGELLIMNHGTPGSGMIYRFWAERCASHGIRLASYSRAVLLPNRVRGAVARTSGLDVLDRLSEQLLVAADGGGIRVAVAQTPNEQDAIHRVGCRAVKDRQPGTVECGKRWRG